MKRATLITILVATLAVYGCSSGDGDGAAGSGGSGSGTAGTGGTGTAGTGGTGTAGTGGSGTAGTGGTGTAGTGGSGTAGTGGSGTAGTGGSGTAGTGGSGTAGTGGSGTAGTGGSGTAGTGGSGTAGTGGSGTAGTGGSGTAGTGGSAGAGGTAEVFYEQDFESLDQTSGTALGTAPGGAGFQVFGNEFQPDGTLIQGYGPFTAPNGTPGFCSIALGEGGTEQGAQQLVIYSDYNNGTNQDAGNLVEANTFQEPFNPGNLITAADLGTYTFSFDAKRGDINSPALPKCDPTEPEYTPNPPCDSTAKAFVKTLLPPAFNETNNFTLDMTTIPDTWDRYSIQIVIDNALIGQVLQFGFAATATNFEPSGVFYDNLLVTVE